MNKKIFQYMIVILVLGLVFIQRTYAENEVEKQLSDNSELTMGVFPRRNVIVTTIMFAPLALYLSEKLGRSVKLVTPQGFR